MKNYRARLILEENQILFFNSLTNFLLNFPPSIESEDGSYNMIGADGGVGSELLECEIDPCEIVNEVDEDDDEEEDHGYVGSQE